MASQVVGASFELLKVRSYVRGYHEYMGVWNPIQGQTLLLKWEPTNAKDKNAVTVLLEDKSLAMYHIMSLSISLNFFEGISTKVS